MTIQGGTQDDTLALASAPSAPVVEWDPGAGNDTLAGRPGENLFAVTAKNAGALTLPGSAATVNFVATENLRGGDGGDTFRFAVLGGVSGWIDGAGGSDMLDYSAFTTTVIVHMIVGQATGTYGIAAIENAIGGSGGDFFTGDGADNIFLGNGGNDYLATRDGDDVAVGGDGDDTIFDTTPPQGGPASERNVLIGGGGRDEIRGFGGAKEELLIGSRPCTTPTSGRCVRSWPSGSRRRTVETRVGHLRGTIPGGLNGRVLLTASGPTATFIDDAIADLMRAGAGPDWFFAAPDDDTDLDADKLLN